MLKHCRLDWTLDYMYFCPDCKILQCPECVQSETMTSFCPNCLFEVPQATVRSEQNNCSRNCFKCPDCTSILQVFLDEKYYLHCAHCQWDSRTVGVVFTKPTGLTSQLQLESPRQQEFKRLMEYYQTMVKIQKASQQPSVLKSMESVLGSHFILSKIKMERKMEEYVSAYVPDPEFLTRFKQMSPDEACSIEQQMRDPLNNPRMMSDLRPLRVQLFAKKLRRCHQCDKELVVPEPKPQATGFTVKHMARQYLPNIWILRQEGNTMELIIKNPLPTDMHLHITSDSHVEPSQLIAPAHVDGWEGLDKSTTTLTVSPATEHTILNIKIDQFQYQVFLGNKTPRC
ncbi:dynactin p62 family-domain-containing protein [Gorgonomyces haynaldii]|nr:dynactin p62 family-domain-containing protein [Gorgonomyces haynaldii]